MPGHVEHFANKTMPSRLQPLHRGTVKQREGAVEGF
jgi:hypothetical protein